MTSPDRFDGLARDVSRLKVGQARLRGDLRQLAAATPISDEQLRRDIDRLGEVVDRLTAQVEALQRWRWQVLGIAGGIATTAGPALQTLLHHLGAT